MTRARPPYPLFPFLLIPFALSAQEAAEDDGRLDPTVVKASEEEPGYAATEATTTTKLDVPLTETPQSVSVITREQLEDRDPSGLGEALRYTPGVQGEPFGFDPRLTFLRIRGFDATTSGLYLDGLQLRNPEFAIGYSLEPYGAERIDVPRGPASVLYGAANPGGLVNFVSKKPTREAFGEVGVRVGSFNRYEARVDVGGPLGSPEYETLTSAKGKTMRVPAGDSPFSYRITGLFRDSETQVDFIDDDRIYIAPAFTWSPNDRTSLTFLAHFQQDETHPSQRYPAAGTLFGNPNGVIPTDRFTGEPGLDEYTRTQFALGYRFRHEIDQNWTVRQNLRFHRTDVDDRTVYPNGIIDDRTVSRALYESFGSVSGLNIDTQVQLDAATGPIEHNLLGGIDYLHTDYDSLQTFGSAPDLDLFNPVYGQPVAPAPVFADKAGTQQQLGLYALEQADFGNGIIVSLGGRYDWAETETDDFLTGASRTQDDTAFSGRAGILYRSEVGLTPYASYAESFQPSIGTDPSGRPFDPETGEQYEIGLKYQPDMSRGSLTLSLFDATRENYTQTDPGTFMPVQTGEIQSRGVELEGIYQTDWGLSLHGEVSLLDTEITESVNPAEIGATPTQVPERTASLWTSYTHQSGALRGWGGSFGVRYLGESYGDTPNTLRAPSATLFDAGIHYEAERFRFDLGVRNLFDKEYIASTFVSGGDFATYGPVRTISTGVTYKW